MFSENTVMKISGSLMVLLVVFLVITSTSCLVVLASYFSALPITKKNLVTRQTKMSYSTSLWNVLSGRPNCWCRQWCGPSGSSAQLACLLFTLVKMLNGLQFFASHSYTGGFLLWKTVMIIYHGWLV